VGCWEYAAEGRSWTFGLFFVFGGQRHDEILIALGGGVGGLRFGERKRVYFWAGLHEKHAVQRGFWVPTQHLL